jgi:hypothetical protein
MNKNGWNALPGYVPRRSKQTNKYMAYAHHSGIGNRLERAITMGNDSAARKHMKGIYDTRVERVNMMRHVWEMLPLRDAEEIGFTKTDWKIDLDKLDPISPVYRNGKRSFSFAIFENVTFAVMRHAFLNLDSCTPLWLADAIPILELESEHATNGLHRHLNDIMTDVVSSPDTLGQISESSVEYLYYIQR